VSLGLCAPVAITVEVEGPDRRVFRVGRQVGEGGIDLGVPAPFEPGRPVALRFEIPGGPPVAVRARVALSGDEAEAEGARGGCRLEFVDPPSEVRRAIMDYVKQRLALP
jgi:hypothetical protein